MHYAIWGQILYIKYLFLWKKMGYFPLILAA